MKIKIVNKKIETHNAVTLYFENSNINFLPGQYATIQVNIHGEDYKRHYSISSHPAEPFLTLTIKAIPNGKVSDYLVYESKIGEEFELIEVAGNFTYKSVKCRNLVFWCAGSGISPVLSLLKEATIKNDFDKCSLIYCYRTENDKIGSSQLFEISQKLGDKFQLIEILSQPSENWLGLKGRVDKEYAIRLLEQISVFSPSQSQHYICGPSGFMQAVTEGLHAFGVTNDAIYKESFGIIPLSSASEAMDAWVTVLIKGKKYEVHVKANQTILEAFLKNKINLPFSCQGGVCSACMVKCIDGKVILPEEQSALSESDILEGYVLTCVGKPASPKIVLQY
jgi:ring-1,2-phenylacetyl-CoA epoxidase subunit PaaE